MKDNTEYKGEIKIDLNKHKLIFSGNDVLFHNYFKDKLYNKIVIKDKKNNTIKDIKITGSDTMQSIIKKYNLEDGISYQEDYSIDVWSAEPERTKTIYNKDVININNDNLTFSISLSNKNIFENIIQKSKIGALNFFKTLEKQSYFNLGIIKDNSKEVILEKLNREYLETNFFNILIEIPNNNYNDSDQNYWVTIFGKKIIYNTELNFNKQIQDILNDDRIKMLKDDIQQFENNFKIQLEQIIAQLDINQKIVWWLNMLEHLKTYLRDFILIINLIKINIEIKKINNWILNIENEIQDLKKQLKEFKNTLNEINIKINYKKPTEYLTCSNLGFLTSGIIGITDGFALIFPVLATIISTISAVGAGISGFIGASCAFTIYIFVLAKKKKKTIL